VTLVMVFLFSAVEISCFFAITQERVVAVMVVMANKGVVGRVLLNEPMTRADIFNLAVIQHEKTNLNKLRCVYIF